MIFASTPVRTWHVVTVYTSNSAGATRCRAERSWWGAGEIVQLRDSDPLPPHVVHLCHACMWARRLEEA